MDEMSEPLKNRRAALDARIRAESARPVPDWRRLGQMRAERERLREQLRALQHPL